MKVEKILCGNFFKPKVGESKREAKNELLLLSDDGEGNMFYAQVYERNNLGKINGKVVDENGIADLFDWKEQDGDFSFKKKYKDRPQIFFYVFNSHIGKEWYGTWQCEGIGHGLAICMKDVMSQRFFDQSAFGMISMQGKNI